MSEPDSLAWYFGIPGAGKTTLSTLHAAELVRVRRWPVLCVNTIGASQLSSIPHSNSCAAAARRVYVEKQHASCQPRCQEEFDELVELAIEHGRTTLLVDEAASWIDAHDRHSPLLRAMRGRRHFDVALLLTTQHMSGDCPQEALSCSPTLYVFNCDSPAVLERMKRDYGIPKELIAQLPQGSFLRIKRGFPERQLRIRKSS